MVTAGGRGGDPRSAMSEAERAAFSARGRPQVAQGSNLRDMLVLGLGLGGVAVLGVVVFLSLNASRQAQASRTAKPVARLQTPPPPPPAQPMVTPKPQAATPPPSDINTHAPVLVLDTAPHHIVKAVHPSPPPTNSSHGDALLGEEQPVTVHSEKMVHPARTIAQGTLIPAVLETAINSDLPGYTRAIVSRDVHSYDGSRVLIPQGSRLVGQYKSGVATGQTRAYVVWSRLLLPSGTSIQLVSPMVDEVGQTGAKGDVDEHYLQRYGPAALFSILGGLIGLAGHNDTAVITTSMQAQSAASEALHNDSRIPPTIRIPPGQPIQVFVARDLVFGK